MIYPIDLPTILSGQKLAYLEPHEEIWAKQTGQWYNIAEHTDKEDTFAPFHGLQNFSIGDVAFPGTFFRFPLRNSSCERRVSSHVYNMNKLRDLLSALREEAKIILLFLRSVKTIEVHELAQHGVCNDLLKVSVQDMARDQLTRRSEFDLKLKSAFERESFKISHPINLTLHVRVVVEDQIDQSNNSECNWLVASRVGSECIQVHNVATELKALPWVGVALNITSAPSGGRVFCVLPMPSEVSCHLPVYVNATFSLNDERRELKWTGTERTNDKSAKWNDLVIQYLLPPCYAHLLLMYAKKYLRAEHFYRAWPVVKQVRGTHWEGILKSLFRYIFSESAQVFWSDGHWIQRSQSLFIPRGHELPSVVSKVLSACGENVVTVPPNVWDALSFMGVSVRTITPRETRSKIKQRSDTYNLCTHVQKLELLQYCLSDNAFDDLSGIALLPLADGTFTTFLQSNYSTLTATVYLCTSEYPCYLTPGCESKLVDIESYGELYQKLFNVAKNKHTQLKLLDSRGVARLLRESMPKHSVVTLPHSNISLEWLEKFWEWVAGHKLELFSNLLVLPVYDTLKCTNAVVRLSLDSPTVFVPSTTSVSHHIQSALSKFHVLCCEQTRFPFVCVPAASLVNHFSPNGVLDAIYNAQHFNNTPVSIQEAASLRQMLCMYSKTLQRKVILQQLAIFTAHVNSDETLFSIHHIQQNMLPGKVQIEPINCPLSTGKLFPHLILFSCSDHYQLELLKTLSVVHPTTIDLLIDSVFPLIRSVGSSDVECIMKEVLENTPTICSGVDLPKKRKLQTEISTLSFLPVFNSSLKSPKSLFDPSNSDLQNLFQGKSVFPLAPFNHEIYLSILRHCGLRRTATPQDIIDIILEICLTDTVGGQAQCVNVTAYKRANAIIQYIRKWDLQIMNESVTIGPSRSRICFSQVLLLLSQKRCWLPVKATPPQDYPESLGWKAKDYTCHFISLGSSAILCHDQELFELACGSQVCFIDHSLPAEICAIFPLDPSMLVEHIVAHLDTVVHSFQQKSILPCHVRTTTRAIYYLLQKHLDLIKKNRSSLPSECVWISRCNVFVSPHCVAIQQNMSFRQNLEPFIYTLPDDLVKYTSLFEALGVVKVVSKMQIMSVLKKIRDGSSTNLGISNEEAWELVMNILYWLTGNGEYMADLSDCETLYVPVESSSAWPTLVESRHVVYTDNDFLRRYVGTSKASEHSFTFVNQRISPQMAHQLYLTPLSQHLDIAEDAFDDVGPNEPLTVRLKNILKEYKDGLTIIKELLQNADDAGATEMNICYDARYHWVEPHSLFFPGMAGCHGPALVVQNNAVFTQDDFKNITKLAGATKEGKALKIGKFGVGFCSVYHITDVPSFISSQYLYIFDPTLSYLKEEIKNPAKPGKRVSYTTSFISSSQQLTPYTGLFGFKQRHQYEGTMFRFPFRTSPSELSEKVYTEHVVKELFRDIQMCSSELLLFLQKVNCITVSQISAGQKVPSIQLKITRATKSLESLYIHKITCVVSGDSTTTSYWLVATETKTVLKQLATASVACLLSPLESSCFTLQPIEGEVFCFLPLSMKTGLPVHVSSNFAVSNNRTGIWASDNSSSNIQEVLWNEALMKSVIPNVYLLLLEGMKQLKLCNLIQEYKFHALWPLEMNLKVHNPWKHLLSALYYSIQKSTLFFSECTGQWLSLAKSQFLSEDILTHSSSTTQPECVLEVVKCMKLCVVDLPQRYYVHLPVNQFMITEEAFLKHFFSKMRNISFEKRNKVLCLMLECFTTELDWQTGNRFIYLNAYLESNACIPCAPDGQLLKKCKEIISPRAEFAAMFEEEENFFPLESFCQKPLVHKAMEVLEMMFSTIPIQLLIERAKTVHLLYKKDKCKALERVQLILKCLKTETTAEDAEEYEALANVSFLPVMPKPEGYSLHWFGEENQLRSGKELMVKGEKYHYGETKQNIYLAGSQVPFTHEVEPKDGGCGYLNYFARRALKIRVAPTLEEVIKHFKLLISVSVSEKVPSDNMIRYFDATARQVYIYLENELKRRQESTALDETSATPLDISTLLTLPCVWTGKQFIYCYQVAQEWKLINGPYLYRTPDCLNRENLRNALNIKKNFTVDDHIKALQRMSSDYGSNELPDDCRLLLSDIISELNTAEISKDHPVIMLPDDSFIMHEASSLAFNDAQWLPHEKSYTYVNRRLVTRDLAKKVGVKMIRSKVADKFSQKQSPFQGTRFGQHEELTNRIHSILEDYPFDVTILKELLQNADDAKATKFYVILDTREHKGERVLSEQWQELQGPALLVWNDKEFSEVDIKGIQKLGIGSKHSDSEKIGQYGIGFNSVYHLTDCPSFVTGGKTLCIFDPHCKYCPLSTPQYPGERFDVSDNFWDCFPDMKAAYLCSSLTNCPRELLKGSLFRFPLRYCQKLVDASGIIGAKGGQGIFEGVLSAGKMHEYLKKWAPQMKQSMFFLNHVTEMKFFIIESKTNSLTVEYHYRVDIDPPAIARRKELHEKISQFKDQEGAEPYITKYQLSLIEVLRGNKYKDQWLIQQGIGDMENSNQVWKFLNFVKPRHGIAAPLNHTPKSGKFSGKVFCFLPLPVDCNLPVHINGHFILTSNRRSLWKPTDVHVDELDHKHQWNKALLKAIASSYASFLMTSKRDFVCEGREVLMKDVYRYYSVFPRWTAPQPLLQRIPPSESTITDSNCGKDRKDDPTKRKHVRKLLSEHIPSIPQKHAGNASVVFSSEEHAQVAQTKVKSTSTFRAVESSVDLSPKTLPALPTGEWLELAKDVFRVLVTSNAHVLAVVHPVSTQPAQSEKRNKDYKHIEWCPLINIKDPASQVYFVKDSQKDSSSSVLSRIGMKLTCTCHWVKKHFADVDCNIPIANAEAAYQYYSEFYKSILSTGKSFPCAISETSFRSVEDFKAFITFILPAINSEENPTFDVPLLLTADELLRFFQEKSEFKVMKSEFSSLFPKCLQWFLHPLLTDLSFNPEGFLSCTEEDENSCLEVITHCLNSVLPACVKCVQRGELHTLKKVWECLNKDELFNHFLRKILQKWALLLSHDNKLLSANESILPIVPLERYCKQPQAGFSDVEDCSERICVEMCRNVTTVFEKLKLPFLNVKVVPHEAIQGICPTLCDPEFVLQVLYHFHCKYDISRQITREMSKLLINYFENVHFKKDFKSLEYLRSLPLFLTHMGKFTSLSGNTVYVWPNHGMCTDGQEIWLKEHNVVFLDWNGAWSSLGLHEELQVYSIDCIEIYTKFIFQHFGRMNEKLRYRHLQFIRDSLLKDAMVQSELKRSNKKHASRFFIAALKELKCIGSNNQVALYSVQDLYDYENIVFRTFKDNFTFLPMFFREGEKFYRYSKRLTDETEKRAATEYRLWREFFECLDLHVEVTKMEYLKLCHEMANQQHTRNTRKKSIVLFEYLFTKAAKKWLEDANFKSEVVEINFVLADKGEGLTWIAPLGGQDTLTIVSDDVCLTKLKGACQHDDVMLVWSVKPVYQVPYVWNTSESEVLADLKLEHRATVVDVIKHLSNISETGRADPKLFDTYTATSPGKDDISLVTVIAECFDFLNSIFLNAGDNYKLKKSDLHILETIPCIPVYKRGIKVVLVRSCQVLMTEDAEKYHPYLHRLPHELMGSSEILERIQVKSSIQLCHLQLVLELAHNQLNNEAMDPNTITIVCHAINDILFLLSRCISDKSLQQLSPLFLPGHDQKLHNSLHLVYPDTYSYKDCRLPDRETGYFLFHYPDTVPDHFDFAKKFCGSLPKDVKPKLLSEICFQQLTAACSSQGKDNEMASCLKIALSLSGLPGACRLVFQKYAGNVELECLEDKLTDFFQSVEVTTVHNLEVDVVLKEGRQRIGTTKVDFFLEQKEGIAGPKFCLHLDSDIDRVAEEHIHETVAQEVLGAICKLIGGNLPSNISTDAIRIFRLFLKAQTNVDLERACQMCDIGLEGLRLQVQSIVPVLGKEIPAELHYMLDQNIQHIFHPGDIVGYELREGYYVFAEVLYVIVPEDFEMEDAQSEMNLLQTSYMISINGETKVVTTIHIHKFLKGKRNDSSIESADDHELDIVDGTQLHYRNVRDAKAQLCQQLKQIWKLNEPEKHRAIRRLYLQWHPDKNLDNLEVANEVFQFLKKQIERLEQGLEPKEDDEDEEVQVSPSTYWKSAYTNWNHTAGTHRTHRQHHTDQYTPRSGGSRYEDIFKDFEQPERDVEKSKLWIQQAKIDYMALEALYSTGNEMLSSHVCFMAHEVAEKALKAGMYATCGLHSRYLSNHDIHTLACSLRGERIQLASELPSLTLPLVPYYLDTRFPNRHPHAVPSLKFLRNHAESAHLNARKILEIISQIVVL